MTDDQFSLFLAGDAMILRPWSHVAEPAFLRLIDEIRAADVSIVNLETIIHEFNGYAQRDSGGAYMASPPAIAAELKWAGFDMLAHANNHTFDYGPSAVLETHEHIGRTGLILAGSGKDLQQARAPRYFERRGVVVGLVAMASTFIPYGAASRSRPDFRGRPGLNPLSLTQRERALVVPPGAAERIRQIGRLLGKEPAKLAHRSFRVGTRFHLGESFGVEKAQQLAEIDRGANLGAIAEAAENADIVVASIHAHIQGRWLREFAGDAIKHGADIVFVHGPHEVRAIEMREGKPIFYSMGDFVFEIESIARHPVEAYEKSGLDDDAAPADIVARARASGRGLLNDAKAFEGFVAVLSIADGRLDQLRLLPVDLQFNGSDDRRGRPQRAAPDMSRRIIETVANLSQRYGTCVRFDPATNCGTVEIA